MQKHLANPYDRPETMPNMRTREFPCVIWELLSMEKHASLFSQASFMVHAIQFPQPIHKSTYNRDEQNFYITWLRFLNWVTGISLFLLQKKDNQKNYSLYCSNPRTFQIFFWKKTLGLSVPLISRQMQLILPLPRPPSGTPLYSLSHNYPCAMQQKKFLKKSEVLPPRFLSHCGAGK